MLDTDGKFLGNAMESRVFAGHTLSLTGYSNEESTEVWHSHENTSISFLLSGTHQEDLCGRHHHRLPGDIKVVPAGETHRCYGYQGQARKINLDLNPALLKQMELGSDAVIKLLQDSQRTKFMLIKLYQELSAGEDTCEVDLQLLLFQLLQRSDRVPGTGKHTPAWVIQLKEILHDEWTAHLDLHDLALRLGVHPVTISRYFPQYFDTTLGLYQKQLKIDHALHLIKATKMSLTEIAYSCGFADQAHFTRTFKVITGFLPKDYRNFGKG